MRGGEDMVRSGGAAMKPRARTQGGVTLLRSRNNGAKKNLYLAKGQFGRGLT